MDFLRTRSELQFFGTMQDWVKSFGNSSNPDVSAHTCEGIATPCRVLFARGRKCCQHQI